jgi:U3 small nucleolar RNA-associated protein 20
MAKHPSTANLLMPSSLGIKKLAAVDRKSISTRDFSECMPVFQSLSDEANATTDFPFTWDQILGPSHCGTPIEMSLCNVIVYECLRCMYDTEVAVRGSALSALKTLVSMAGKWSGLHPSTSSSCTSHFTLELIKTIVLPGVHLGIKLGLDNVKKGFVQLLNHIIKNLSRYCLPQDQEAFHTDLFFLTNEDPEQDFFESITHIQLHRRSRVLLKLKGLLSTNRNITNRSFLNVLLPLAFYPLLSEEFKKKEHAVLLQESSSLIGMIAFYLKWGQYYALIKQLLKHLRRNKDKEKLFLSTLCSVLESFHFDLTVHTTDNETSKVEEEDGHGDDDDEESDNEQEAKEDTELDQSPPPLPISSNEHIIQCVLNTIYPQVKSFLIKHGKDHTGGKTEIVRPLIAVALIKLLKRFEPPLLSQEKRNGLFTNLVLNVVNTLKTKDSAARDMARESLAKMVTSMGLESLGLVLDELSHSLSQGYQRHVRNYTVRSLLTTVLANYSPPIDAESILDVSGVNNIEISEDDVVFPSFDQCIPLIMQFCLDEIEGTTFEDKNVDDAKRTLIREAKGNKANEIFELCGRCLLFRPSNALANPQLSSVHLLITPLLEALRQSQRNDFSTTTSGLMGRTTEGLLRASIGLSKNPSLKGTELFLYLHSTLTPFVATLLKELKSRKETAGNIKIDQSGEDEALSSYIPSYLKEESSDEDEAALYSKKQKTDKSKQTKANVWLPSERKVNTAQKEAIERRNEERRELFLVQDGASAPKLTGRNRYKRKLANHEGKNFLEDDPAFTAAVKFCLSLLLSCLKQKRLDESDPIVREMATPFLPLFAQCLRISGNSGIVVLAMRCICGLLSWGLPVEPEFSRSIGKRMLELIYQGGAVLSTDNDLVQTCIKGLYSLFLLYNKSKNQAKDFATFNPLNSSVDEIADTPLPKKSNEKLPLDIDSIRTLLSLLTSSILEVSTSYQNSSFQLIRAIVDSRIVVPEMYDLMKALIEQVVLSHRKGVRDVASTVVVTFLLSYPLGKKRLESHIKQFVANCSYEFEEGRFAALGLILDLCRLLPVPVLDEYALLIYLPMAMQVVNDNSSTCRSRAGDVITMLIRRCSVEMATQCWNYSLQWLGIQNEPGELETYQGRCVDISQRPLMRTGAQVAGIVVGSRHDIIKRNMVNNILLMMTALLTQFALVENKIDLEQEQETAVVTENEGDGNVGGLETWALLYHFLTLLERLFEQLPLVVEKSIVMIQKSDNPPRHLFELLEEAMLFPHAWVRSVSCRIIKSYLQRRDPIASNFGSIAHGSSSVSEIEILLTPNALYNLARRLCLMLNYPVILPSLLPSLTSCLVFVIRAMYYHPSLVTKIDQPLEEEVDSEPKSEDENDESSPSVPTEPSLVASSNWAMQRLRAIGGDPRGSKRLNVLKV